MKTFSTRMSLNVFCETKQKRFSHTSGYHDKKLKRTRMIKTILGDDSIFGLLPFGINISFGEECFLSKVSGVDASFRRNFQALVLFLAQSLGSIGLINFSSKF